MSGSRLAGMFSIVSTCFALYVAAGGQPAAGLPAGRLPTGFPASDTLLTDSIRAGQVLIRRLPERLSGRTVEAYHPVVVPATGWLHDRSFFWRVPGDLTGTFRFVFAATSRGAEPDTVLVQVQVSPQ